jgi:medium-chain acyl-[acyl-carrier-protein] hydrolase
MQHHLRLYCFCYAGGNALSYIPWQSSIDPAIEICAIQLPGRGARIAETPVTSMPALVESISHAIERQRDMPFAFFGHSLGALLAFELVRYRKRLGLPMPLHLFVSGCDAPQFRDPPKGLHKFSDDALIDALKEYNGTPPEILAHRELMELVLPTVRADFSLAENYQYDGGLLLDTLMTVMAGTADDRSSLEQVEGWAKETAANCDIQWFEGDHFFINPQKEAVINCINEALRPSLANLAAA